MFSIKKYATVHSLDEAYELLHKNRNNRILGGLMWLKMGTGRYHTGIDLSKLGLDTIVEYGDKISIGCMCSLRQIETSEVLLNNFSQILPLAVKDIVGVQFRNSATFGASVYSKYGFSDIITALLVLDTEVELYHHGIVPLETFLMNTYHKDILVRVNIKKQPVKAAFLCERYTATDFSMINVAVSQRLEDGTWKIAVGARPSLAKLAVSGMNILSPCPTQVDIEMAAIKMVSELSFGTNIKASKEYREQLAKVLVKRGIQQLCI